MTNYDALSQAIRHAMAAADKPQHPTTGGAQKSTAQAYHARTNPRNGARCVRILGLDPGLQNTGWGIIEWDGSRMAYVADGAIHPPKTGSMASRLAALFAQLQALVRDFEPHEAAVEETFVNKNPTSTLRLGQARGVVLVAPALAGVPVAEYAPNKIKKSVVGAGHAGKAQVDMMVRTLLPGCLAASADAADALAIAICHAHHRNGIVR